MTALDAVLISLKENAWSSGRDKMVIAYLEQLQSIFDEMEIMEEFEDAVWIKVSKATLFGENME